MMTLDANITEYDLAYVKAHPWQRTAEEFVAFGVDPEVVGALVKHSQPNAWTIRLHGAPVVIFGADRTRAGAFAWETWFVASSLFESEGLAVTRLLRRHLRASMRRLNARMVYSESCATHPMAERWFRLLGFWRDPNFKREGADGRPIARFILKSEEAVCA